MRERQPSPTEQLADKWDREAERIEARIAQGPHTDHPLEMFDRARMIIAARSYRQQAEELRRIA